MPLFLFPQRALCGICFACSPFIPWKTKDSNVSSQDSPFTLKIKIDNRKKTVFRCNAVSKNDLDRLPGYIQELMSRVRPHAVNLVDSWMIPDYLLDR